MRGRRISRISRVIVLLAPLPTINEAYPFDRDEIRLSSRAVQVFTMDPNSKGQKAREFGVEDESAVSTHILDTTAGRPANGVPVRLYRNRNDAWILLKESTTDTNGRCSGLASRRDFEVGRYKLSFGVGRYFEEAKVEAMYPVIEVIFDVKNDRERYHVPLLLNPYGFTTYRGS